MTLRHKAVQSVSLCVCWVSQIFNKWVLTAHDINNESCIWRITSRLLTEANLTVYWPAVYSPHEMQILTLCYVTSWLSYLISWCIYIFKWELYPEGHRSGALPCERRFRSWFEIARWPIFMSLCTHANKINKACSKRRNCKIMHNELHKYNQSINDEACFRSLDLTQIIQLQNYGCNSSK